MYPQLEININKLHNNVSHIIKMAKQRNIKISLVSKVLAGNKKIVQELMIHEFSHLADSRIENLIKFKDLRLPKLLLRIPMPSELNKVVKYCDVSLNSDLLTIRKLNEIAKKHRKVHNIILMFDLGDLREGIFFQDDYLSIVSEILKLSNIKLLGIGTNLTCYGGIVPSINNLSQLVKIKKTIEKEFNYHLEIISGGNSSSLYLLENHDFPNEINNLRIGEAIFLGRETAYGHLLERLHDDIFILKAQLVEVYNKPSYPIGEMSMDSFGNKPQIIDKGNMTRGILAIGKQDIQLDNLIPQGKFQIIGGSSDHLIIDLNNQNYHVGDILSFKINYPGLLQLMTSKYIKKVIIK